MNAFFGFVQFQNSESHSEKNKYFSNAVFLAFPTRFPRRKIISENNIALAGDFESFCTEGKSLFFNGEIYNRQEIEKVLGISSSLHKSNAALVCELILQKGLEAVQIINGQFLIIYVNKQDQKVHLINDHMGIRQLYYYHDKNILLFGSEIKFLLVHPDCSKDIDWETSLKRPHPSNVLSCFKSYKTWFNGVNLLPEASIIHSDSKKKEIKISTYWNHTERTNYDYKDDRRTAKDVMEEYISLLDDSIKIRINNQSTNYSLLSGGLDSSAIVALGAKYSPLETFSIITQTTYLEDTTSICTNLANDLHIKNSQFLIPIHEISFNTNLWKQWIWRMESPVNHTDSLTKTLLHYAIRKKYPDVKSVLTGTGSDQLNGGLVRWIVNDNGNEEENWENFHREIQDRENHKIITQKDDDLWNCRNLINREYLVSISENAIENNSWMHYVNSTLHSELFSLRWDEVRASNYHGHETRFPFLDFRFIDFIAKIPPKLHKELFFDKPILRIPLKKILPEYVLNKPKVPAYIPDYDYRFKLYNFLTSNKNLMEEALDAIDQSHPVINKPAFFKRIKLLQENPNIFEWNNIMKILNIGLLEKLVGKNEKEMDIESLIEEPIEIDFNESRKTKIFLETKLSIKNKNSAEIDLQKPLFFRENCALLFNSMNNKFFLSKGNELAFEIEDQYTDWKNFLIKIDNKQSIQQLLDDLSISYHIIEGFLKIALEEKILCVARAITNKV